MLHQKTRLTRFSSVFWAMLVSFCFIAQISGLTQPLSAAECDQQVNATLLIRYPVDSPPITPESIYKMGALKPDQRTYLTRGEFDVIYGMDPSDELKVKAFCKKNHLKVLDISSARRLVTVTGTKEALQSALGSMPKEMAPIIRHVFFDTQEPPISEGGFPSIPTMATYTPPQVGQIYNYPKDLDGSGVTVGIMGFGGGFDREILSDYFRYLTIPMPEITSVSIRGYENTYSTPPSAMDVEIMMDIEVAAAVAPGAKFVVYLGRNDARGWYEGLSTAIHDNINNPAILSLSFALPESKTIQTEMALINQLFMEAALLGMTVTASSGDLGSSAGVDDGLAHAYFPASSPFVIATGGTTLIAQGSEIKSEVTWDVPKVGAASGGGISAFFPLPAWQKKAGVPPSVNPGHQTGRGLPDMAGNANLLTGYVISYNKGELSPYGSGTSAVAPLVAALFAMINQKSNVSVGYVNPLLYNLETMTDSNLFYDVTKGDNGAYQASAGWDACTGWGSPDGIKLLNALTH